MSAEEFRAQLREMLADAFAQPDIRAHWRAIAANPNWPSIRKHLLRGASARRVFKQCRPDLFAQIFAAESAVESDSTRDFGKSSRVRLRPSRRQKRSEG